MTDASRSSDSAFASAVRRRDPDALAELTAIALVPAHALLVPRPWGGDAIRRHKGIADAGAELVGESFEISAAPADEESRAWPTMIALPDGGELPLATVLHACPAILGDAHVLAWGYELPLLPKLLDVAGLLSVQAHPPGHPEAYVVIDAEPGATLSLGLRRDLDPGELAAQLAEAQTLQRELAGFVGDDAGLAAEVSRWLLGEPGALPPALAARVEPIAAGLTRLRAASTALLDAMHTIAVAPGTIVHNCVVDERTGLANATLHALGNRARKRVLALEVRVAGPTLRAWDHGRLPMRELDVAAALAACSTRASAADGFVVAEGDASCTIDNGVFALSRERIDLGTRSFAGGCAELVHALGGAIAIAGPSGRELVIAAGHSALVPAAWSSWQVRGIGVGASLLRAHLCPRETRLGACTRSFARLREGVLGDHGPRDVLVIANGGDGEVVGERLRKRATELFRARGDTRIVVHEETTRRGQLLGSLDAIAAWRAASGQTESDGVMLGIMLPGQGTRLSPLTQRLHGIKPFAPMPVRTHPGGEWLDAGSASLYSWTAVTRELERMGFRGVAWKWGDEPQIPERALDRLELDLRGVDAVRFGIEVEITDDLARNKEWLLCGADDRLLVQLRRRPEPALRERLAQAGSSARALVHIGSPALSWPFIAALEAELGGWSGWLDVDGYVFEALTHDDAAWELELARDEGLRTLVRERPDFRARMAAVRSRIEDVRGAPLAIAVVDFGAGAWWGDMGQLSRAREAFAALVARGEDGELARRLAGIADVVPDRFGNRVVGHSIVPDDGRVTDSVLVDASIVAGRIDRAVVIGSQLGRANVQPGAVVVDSTLGELEAAPDTLVMGAIADQLHARAHAVHTSIPADPAAPGGLLEPWWFDARLDPGSAEHYRERFADNPCSFADKAAQMRQRAVAPSSIEAALLERRRRLAATFGPPTPRR